MKPFISLCQYGKRKALSLALSLGLAAGVMATQIMPTEAQDSKTKTESRITVHQGTASNPESTDSYTVANRLRGSASKSSLPSSIFEPWWKTMQRDPDAAWMLRNLDLMTSDFDRAWSFPTGIGSYIPKMDTTDQGNNIKITTEVPGIEEKDLDVVVNDDSISIRGDKKGETTEQKSGKVVRTVERSYGSFERTIGLPCKVQSEKADAFLKNGVLTITLPKRDLAANEGRKISIRTE